MPGQKGGNGPASDAGMLQRGRRSAFKVKVHSERNASTPELTHGLYGVAIDLQLICGEQ